MKTCPSCGSELADDAKECLCGYTYEEELEELEVSESDEALSGAALSEEGAEDAETGGSEGGYEGGFEEEGGLLEEEEPEPGYEEPLPPLEEGAPQLKHCSFCGSEINLYATRCPHCAGFLPIIEGTAFKQHFFFLFSCVALLVGALLPWERTYLKANLTGADAIGGGFLIAFAIYGIFASWWNIYHRKMIVWPVLLAAVDGAVLGWQRVFQVLGNFEANITATGSFGQFVQNVQQHVRALGPGLYLVTIFSTLVILSVFIGIFKGAKQDAARKAADREARAGARRSRRT
jgi:hypothetical protein